MLGTLVDINSKGNIFLVDKSIALAPKLWEVYKNKNMGSNMIRYIVSMYDYKSIYRKLPIQQREKRVIRSIWEDKPNKYINHKLVKEAIEEYNSLQYDPDIDTYNVMLEKAVDINQVYKDLKVTKDNLDEVNVLQDKMAKAAESRIKVAEIIKKNEESDMKIFGKKGSGKQFSRIEEKLRDSDR